MKKNSTQHSTSGTYSFAAAAQKNTTKANPATQHPSSQQQQQPQPSQQQQSASLNQSAPASQTQPSTATTSSSGSQGAAVSSNNPSSQSKPQHQQQQSAPKPGTPSTANGNYSAVAAKANNAANRRSQAPTAAAAVKGLPAGKPTAAAVVAAAANPASTTSVPASGSPASRISFGSINEPESGSTPATASETAPVAQATGTAMTFGSIAASQMIPSKPEETPAAVAPVAASQEPVQPVSHAPEHINPYKPIPQHVPQQHMSHGHHAHRRTDSTSSAHSNDPSHYRSQPPPAVSQPQMMPPMGLAQPGIPYTSRAPAKGHGMAPMNPQPQIHAMHHQQSWQPPQQHYYVYDQQQYYQPQMYPQYIPSQQRMNSRPPYNTQTTYQPPAPAKKITIKNPNTKAEIQLSDFASAADNKAQKAPATVELKKPEEEKIEYVKPSTAKSAIPIVSPEEKERELKEKEEKERKEKEEKERIEREAKEAEERRIREEQAEKERLEAEARAEQERKEKEERERKEKEERERKEKEERERKEQEERERKEQEERERKEREERERKEQEEKERLEKERALEAERKRKEEEERIAREKAEAEKARLEKEKAEQEAKEKLEAERREKEKLKQEEASKAEAEKSETPAVESKPILDSAKSGLSVDLSRTTSAPPSSLSARIENFSAVSYPSHIQSPGNPDGQNKYRYDRDFLMQFMNVCTDKPDSLPSLDVLGGDGNDRGMQSPGGARGGGPRGAMGNGRKPSQPMAAMGSFSIGNIKLSGGGMPMGMRNPSTDGRLHRTNSDNNFLPRNNNLSRPPSQRGSRGGKRGGGGQGRGGDRGHQEPALTIPLADIVPLEKTENAWTPNVNANSNSSIVTTDEHVDQDQVARKVKGLLNKLTLERFDSISDKVVEIANLSSKEKDGATLKHCIQIIFEKATDEPNFGSVYAMLCQRLMEKISPDVKDATVDGSTGGKLFRKYLLHRCQEEFTRGWKDKITAGGVSLNDKDGPDLMSDEYYIMMKAKRQGLGLIHFIGELFKLNMLTEKIMHECVKKLLANVKDPEEEETEGLCKLMTTVGLQLDRPEAKNHMDVYFIRMGELTKNTKLPSRIRFMVQDVIDLRANKWVNRRAAAGPKTIAAIHEEAQRQQEEKEMMRRTASSGGGRGLPNRREQLGRAPSYRGSGDARHDMGGVPQVGADGWSTVTGSGPVMAKKAGDLSSFGNTSRSKVNGLPSLGPSQSVFGSLTKGKRAGDKAATQADTSRQLSTNIFAALEGDGGDRRSSVDAEKPMERKKLNLAPRTVPIVGADSTPSAEAKAPESDAPKKTEEEAKRSIENTLKEYLSLKDMTEMLTSIKELDVCYRPLLVTEFVNQSMEMKQSDVDSIAEVFKKLNSEKILSTEDFESGFADPLEFLPDTAIDVPNAYKYASQLLEAAGMDPAKAAKP
ncbi:hypothetical protein BGX21_011096 [Mortierella sp. AD011]|nr:hypothetical protein BGX21_011096 [Mortierella sp. AD011]